jgi:hypothetical protein
MILLRIRCPYCEEYALALSKLLNLHITFERLTKPNTELHRTYF